MIVRGAVFLHEEFEFKDGFSGIKRIVLLNTPKNTDNYLFVKTTSQKKDKPETPGCLAHPSSLFYIPEGRAAPFPLNTWVQFHELYPMTPDSIIGNERVRRLGTLDVKMIDDIVNCLFETEGDNISPAYERFLRPPITSSILQLKDKWNA